MMENEYIRIPKKRYEQALSQIEDELKRLDRLGVDKGPLYNVLLTFAGKNDPNPADE